jgi:hypothetical protein
MKQSERFTLNSKDIKGWLKNVLIFAAPDLVVFLGALSLKFSADGAIVAVLLLNILIDLIKKFVAGK